jgi:hypothetical protein
MPATDNCEPQIIRALEKASWDVVDKPYTIFLPQEKGFVLADLRLQHRVTKQRMIVVEVKCFNSGQPVVDEFYRAVGQYWMYRSGIRLKQIDYPVYLAVPSHIYATFFQRAVIQNIIHESGIKILVVNLEKEEIMQWLD